MEMDPNFASKYGRGALPQEKESAILGQLIASSLLNHKTIQRPDHQIPKTANDAD